MNEIQKKYYIRFAQFTIDCALLTNQLDWRLPSNKEWGKQLIRSSGSVPANYIEAVEALSDADFIYRYGICLKESKESVHWLFLLKKTNDKKFHSEMNRLMKEGCEFIKIFSSSIETKKKNIKLEKENKRKENKNMTNEHMVI